MSQTTQQVVLITGASSGIGLACAQHLSQRGYRVFGASRRGSASAGDSASFEMLKMDVDSDASVQQGVGWIAQQTGRLDAVVNSAGFGLAGAVEDTSIEEAKAQLETNLFGAVRVCQAALPLMRAQRSGCIVNISSIGGLVGIPFQGFYSASKFALEGLTEALRLEVRPWGIRVVLIEPGDFSTQLTANRRRAARSLGASAYTQACASALRVMETDERNGPAPSLIAGLLERILKNPRPRLRYTIGPFSERAAAALKKFLPGWFFEWGVAQYYQLP